MKKNLKYLSYISFPLLYLFASNACAGLFDPPISDKSLEYLGVMFGSNIGSIYIAGNTPNLVISGMFEKFNTIIVIIATVIISYIGIVSTTNTAQEGQVMGRKWSSIWLPMRSALGMLLMVPTPASGYSLIQVSIMWIIIQSIGAADQIWSLVANYMKDGISVSTELILEDGISETNLNVSARMLLIPLINSAICAESIKQLATTTAKDDNNPPQTIAIPESGSTNADYITKYGAVTGAYQTTPTVTSTTQDPITYTAYFNIGAQNPTETGEVGSIYSTICGSYKIDASVNRDELVALGLTGAALDTETDTRALNAINIKLLAIKSMYSVLSTIAKNIVDYQVQPRDGARLKMGVTPTPSGYLDAAISTYLSNMKQLIKPSFSNSHLVDAATKGQEAGWITAGAFYTLLHSSLKQNLLSTAFAQTIIASYVGNSSQSSVPTCPQGSSDGLCASSRPDSYYSDTTDGPKTLAGIQEYISTTPEIAYIAKRLLDGNVYLRYDTSVDLGSYLDLADSDDSSGGKIGKFLHPMRGLTKDAVRWFSQLLTGSYNDPLLGIASFGAKLMNAAEIIWLSVAAIAFALAWVPFSLKFLPPLLAVLMPVILAILGLLWICGATMSVYIPMVPYMIYTVTALGWFLLVIEVMIAAPIISLGLVIPSGEELGKVASALMLLVSTALRPTLMVFGFIFASELFKAFISLVNFCISDALNAIPGMGDSLFAPIVVIALYDGFIMASVNKCFAAIHIVPDKILRWIGGPHEQTDISAVHETKSSVDKGAKMGADVAEGVSKGTGDAAVANINKVANKTVGESKKGVDGSGMLGGGAGNPLGGGGNPLGGGSGGKPPV